MTLMDCLLSMKSSALSLWLLWVQVAILGGGGYIASFSGVLILVLNTCAFLQ